MKKVLLISFLALLMLVSCNKGSSSGDLVAKATEATEKTQETSQPKTEAPTESPKVEESSATSSAPVAETTSEEPVEGTTIVLPSDIVEKFSYVVGQICGQYGEEATIAFAYYQTYYYTDLMDSFGYMGISDYLQGVSFYSEEEMNNILEEYFAIYDAKVEAKAQENLKIAEDFLANNKNQEGVITTESGLQYKFEKKGDGPIPTRTQSVEVDYELTLLDGTVIDSSYDRGEHATFSLSSLIEGFTEACCLSPIGSKITVWIHPDLGYGPNPSGAIEGNSLLIFTIELYSIAQ
ncbi:MAG: FKBP-type peptidyl-prolyl cis-trans isomerase [Sphaerochaetaceae bacterium]|nr:FKBP-type peptidyl-prolyl cis-trans isomerase [Sphaerochaetaceae bacterium]